MSYDSVSTTATGAQTLDLTKFPNEGVAAVEIYGTFGTLAFKFQASYDGTNFVPLLAIDNSTGLPVTGATSITPTDNTATSWTIPNAANIVTIRLNVTGLVSVTSLTAKSFGAATTDGLPLAVATATSGSFGSVTSTGSILSSSATGGIGYTTGAGGTVTQGTNRTTAVVLNTVCGNIVLFSAAGSATPFTFQLTNSAIAAGDVVTINQKSGTDKYTTQVVTGVAAGSCQITLANASGTTTEQPVFNFQVHKGVAA